MNLETPLDGSEIFALQKIFFQAAFWKRLVFICCAIQSLAGGAMWQMKSGLDGAFIQKITLSCGVPFEKDARPGNFPIEGVPERYVKEKFFLK